MNDQQTPEHLPPPIFRTWKQMFIAVLLIHVFVMLSFYVFTLYFNAG